jgi:hypothetical protein
VLPARWWLLFLLRVLGSGVHERYPSAVTVHDGHDLNGHHVHLQPCDWDACVVTYLTASS